MVRKPKQQRAINTVNSIVEGGFLCVSKYGLAGTTTQKISEISGVSMGSIYEYFENKEAIFEAMRQHFMQDVISLIQSNVHDMRDKTIHEVIRNILETIKQVLEHRNGVYMKWFKESVDIDGSLQSQAHLDQARVVFTQITLNYMMSHPELMRLKNLNVMIYIFVNAGIFTVMRFLTEPVAPNFSFDQLVDGLGDMVNGFIQHELSKEYGLTS